MVYQFSTSPTELELEYSHAIDSLFSKFDAIQIKEENYVSLFSRSVQDNIEHIDLDAYLETCEKKENVHQLMWAYEKRHIEEVRKKFTDIDREFVTLDQSIQKAIEMSKCEEDLASLKSSYAEMESRMRELESDSSELKTSNQKKMDMIRSIESDDQKSISQYNDSISLPIKITETLVGIKVIEADSAAEHQVDQTETSSTSASSASSSPADRISNRFDVMFLDLPDDFLNFDDNNQGVPLSNSQIKLSVGLLEKYRAIHRKRKQQGGSAQSGRGLLNGLVVSNLSDFKTVYENFQTLLCAYLTKQEIEKAGKRFGVDWIEGSPVISVLVDSKATKMATLVLTKYYPTCGTSMIKLTSMSGYENSVIKSFRIAQNLGSLLEWIEQFIELYRTNQLE